MAIDALGGPISSDVHRLHHDLESLLYVIIWVCTIQSGPAGAKRQFEYAKTELYGWNAGDGVQITMRNIWDAKSNVMTNRQFFERLVLSNFDDYFAPMASFVEQLREIIFPSGSLTSPKFLPPSEREASDVVSEYLAVLTAAHTHIKSLPGMSLKTLPDAPPDSVPNTSSNDSVDDDDTELVPRRPMDLQWVRLESGDILDDA